MNPSTLNLVVYIEQLAALVAKLVVDLHNVIAPANAQVVDQILADADAEYAKIIAAAKLVVAPTPPPNA
jgi:hypothetical protein